jgi:hypothetical protein
MVKLYKELSSRIDQYNRCIETGNSLWQEKTREALKELTALLPHGSGIESTSIDLEKSNGEKIVIVFSYHFMNDAGFYDGYGDFILTVKPSLQFDFILNISGKDRNQIKDYFYDMFQCALSEEIDKGVK